MAIEPAERSTDAVQVLIRYFSLWLATRQSCKLGLQLLPVSGREHHVEGPCSATVHTSPALCCSLARALQGLAAREARRTRQLVRIETVNTA